MNILYAMVGTILGLSLLFFLGYIGMKLFMSPSTPKGSSSNVGSNDRWDRLKKSSKWIGGLFKNTTFLIFICFVCALALVNWAIYAISPIFWTSFWCSTGKFWASNVIVLFATLLLFVKGEDKKPNKATLFFSKVLFGLAGVIFLSFVLDYSRNTEWFKNHISSSSSNNVNQASADTLMEIELREIRMAESGDQHIDPKTGDLIKNPRSSARGVYQYIEAHWPIAEKLGYKLNSREAQEGYAQWNYKNNGRTKIWENDPYGSYRWITKLMSMGYDRWGSVDAKVIAPTKDDGDGWSGKVIVHKGINFQINRWTGHYIVRSNKGTEIRVDENYTNQTFPKGEAIEYLEFRSLAAEPVEVSLTFRRGSSQ